MGGSKKDSKVKPATASSIFSGVKNTTTALPGFGTATSQVQGDTINNAFSPDPGIATMLSAAKQGMQANQGVFGLTPEQQFGQVDTSPYYLYAREQNNSFLDTEQAEARQAASRSGLENSTIAGAIEASLLNGASERDLMARLNSIDYARSIAGENLGVNQGIMDQIYGYTSEPLQMSSQTLMKAGDNQDQVGMFNAGQVQQSRMMNAQLAEAARARRSAMIGNLISAGASLAAAPMTGGASLIGAGVGQLGSMFTKKAG